MHKNKSHDKPNISLFFETLAKILSEKYGAEITYIPNEIKEERSA